MPAWLMTHLGHEYLLREYETEKRSTVDIATELGTYPNRIVRALRKHGIAIRSRSEARLAGLDTGRVLPPMLGKVHRPDSKVRISSSLNLHFQNPDRVDNGEDKTNEG